MLVNSCHRTWHNPTDKMSGAICKLQKRIIHAPVAGGSLRSKLDVDIVAKAPWEIEVGCLGIYEWSVAE